MNKKHLRGSSTAGRGSGKRTRKAGNRGGRGRAGGGKRGQQKQTSFLANRHTYSYSNKRNIPLNLSRVGSLIQSLEKRGEVEKDGERYVLKLDKLGYSKVCGRFGNEKFKLAVYGKASKKALDELKAAGGDVYE